MMALSLVVGVALTQLQPQPDGKIPPPRKTPVMAWNAWNTFSVNGKPLRGGRPEYETMVEALVERGYVAAGYTLLSTVCTDWIGRDPATHALQENTTLWPGGMKAFSEYVHGKGMGLSVYTDAGRLNCCQEPGSLGYEALDMKTFASWGVDGVGVDYCGGPGDVEPEYENFAVGIAQSGRAMQLGVWNLGQGRAHTWAPAMSRNMTEASPGHGSWIPHFRSTRDIGNYWSGKIGNTESVVDTVKQIQAIADLWDYGMGNESGTYPNYGQMPIGDPPNHPSIGDPGLSLVEAQSTFSMWCMFPAMLMITNDARSADVDIERILLNNETIAVNQDPWGLPAFRIASDSVCAGMQWARQLANGDVAVVVLNLDDNDSVTARIDFSTFLDGKPAGAYKVRDVQGKKDLGVACQHLSLELAPHATAFVRLTKVSEACTPTPAPPCTPAPPAPAPPPPLPPCPSGYTVHASGYWARPNERTSAGHSKSVPDCGAYCTTKPGCVAFEVYDPSAVTAPIARGGSACYTFNSTKGAFTPDDRGLIRTCTKTNRATTG